MSSFKVWIKDGNVTTNNTVDEQTWITDSADQRVNGFKAGTPASSKQVNTALRQANLVTSALMDQIVGNDSTLNFTSNVADVKAAINKYFTETLVAKTAITAGNAIKINNLEIKQDSNGVLKIGDVIIPQKKLISDISSNPQDEIILEETINAKDVLEVVYGLIVLKDGYWTGLTGAISQKIYLDTNKKIKQPIFNVNTYAVNSSGDNVTSLTLNVIDMGFSYYPDTNKLSLMYNPNFAQEITRNMTNNTFTKSSDTEKYKPVIYKVYKVIE